MRLRGFFSGGVLAAAAALASIGSLVPMTLASEAAPSPAPARRRKLVSAQAPQRFRRSRGPQAGRRARPNRLITSRRVRRRHRRARAA